MAARLPTPGSDDGTWGTVLNDYLGVVHNVDGTLKDSIVAEAKLSSAVQTKLNTVGGTPADGSITTAKLADGAVTNVKIANNAVTNAKLDSATQTSLGKADSAVQSVNGHSGPAAVTVTQTDVGLGNVDNTSDATKNSATATLANKTISGASNTLSNIPESAVTNLTTDLAAKATDTTVVHKATTETVTGSKDFTGGITANGVNIVVTTDSRLVRVATTTTKTGAYTATTNQLVPCDVSGGTFAVTLPTGATAGEPVIVKKLDSSTNVVTIQRGGSDVINVAATSVTLTLPNQSAVFMPNGSGVWMVMAGDVPLTQLDARYAKSALVPLTDAATIATDVSIGSLFRVTLGGNRTLGNPTNPVDGQRVMWELIQDATGSRTLALDTKFVVSPDIGTITLSTTATRRDHLGAVYNATADKWDIIAFVRGG